MFVYKNGFFNSALKAAYDAAGNWPTDGVEVSDQDYLVLMVKSSDMDIKPDDNGYPVAVPRVTLSGKS